MGFENGNVSVTQHNANARSRWFRPVRIWLPTWRLALLLLVTIVGAVVWCVRSAYEFLAISKPVAARVLVVEGWMPDYALAWALEEFDRGGYELLITSGGPIERGGFLVDYENHAALTAASLVRMGFDGDRLVAVPANAVLRDRTRASAVAVRDWLAGHGRSGLSVNVVSLGAHSRRSWIVYQKVFGHGASVGVLAAPARDMDPERWWRSSEGIKVTAVESIGCLYESLAGRRH